MRLLLFFPWAGTLHLILKTEPMRYAFLLSDFPFWLESASVDVAEHILCGSEPLLDLWTTAETCYASNNVGMTGPVEMAGKMFCSAVQCCSFCGEHRPASDVQRQTLFVPLHQTTQQHTHINLVPSLLSVWDWLHGLLPQHYGSYEGS